MTDLFNFGVQRPTTVSSQRRELTIEILKFLTPALGLVLFIVSLSNRYPWLSKPWVWDGLAFLGIVVVLLFAKPHLSRWWKKIAQKKRRRQFIVANAARIGELSQQFFEFISDNNSRSLVYLVLRNGYPQVTGLEGIFANNYIGAWFHSYREQLAFPAGDLARFLARCREFGNLVQQFNSHYVLRLESVLAAPTAPSLSEQSVRQLEAFREEYNDFLRNVERWSKGITAFLQSAGVTDQSEQWRLAPTAYFQKPQSFRPNQPALK